MGAFSFSAKRDLSRGNMTSNLLAFAIPFLLANFLQALYGAVDLWVVGKFGGGKIAVAAVGNGGAVMHMVMAFIMGLTTGATVLIGQFFGAGDKRNTSRSIGMALSFSGILGIIFTFLFVFGSPLMVDLIRVPEEAVASTVDYLRICSWGVFFIFGYNILAAIFRGFGNSTAPLIFVGIACLVNVVADLVLVAGFDMGVRGAAYATIASQGLSMFFALWYLWKGDFGFKFALPNFRLVWDLVSRFIRIGLPIAVQSVLINLSFMFILVIVNNMGGGESSATSAGYGIVTRINGFTMLPAMSFSMALSAITAQNIGASKPVRAIKTMWLAIAYTFACGLVCFGAMQIWPEFIVGLFIDKNTPGADEVIRMGALYARSFSFDYIMVPIVFCTNGFFNGCGRSLFSMINNLTGTFLLRVPGSYFFSIMVGATLYHVGFAAPLASLLSNIIAIIYLLSGKWKPGRNYMTAVKNR